VADANCFSGRPESAVCRFAVLILFCGGAVLRADSAGQAPLTDRERELLNRIESLEKRVAALEARAGTVSAPAAAAPAPPAPVSNTPPEEAAKRGIPGLPGTTLNFYFDGYYGWNFNRPLGRVNLLRANDVLSNNFSLNQIGLIFERAPDLAAGRRYGGRVDLMFGQNTEGLQGGAQNEPRPQAYRNIYQAYGTYVFPLGSGLTVDFGKFYSSLGVENNYAYDEINYSRSYYFAFLPAYHMGARSTYNVNDKLTVQHWIVNGANQTEDFNGYKSNAFLFTVKPVKDLSWNLNYYFGREGRELVPDYNPTIPTLPTQPGLSVTPLPGPKPNGRTHIFDTYATWSPAGPLTLAGEFDRVVSRAAAQGPASSVTGGAGYLQYRFTPRFTLAGRFEFLRDHGGLFSGITQDLKEHTVTATYQFADGFQVRLEHRRDFSNRAFFLSSQPGVLKKNQNTLTMGLIWWFGGKRESW
jgi:hypothetical protein